MGTHGVNTSRADRRRLRFNSLAELRAEVERVAAADRAGALRRTGNWTTGQVFGHLTTWMEFAWTPNPLKPPWLVRFIAARQKNKHLNKAMRPGARIPGVEGGTLGTKPTAMDEGLANLRDAIDRLEREAPTCPSPLFGMLTREEAIKLNLRHAELHLSFLHPE